MKKRLLFIVTILTVLFISACSHNDNELSGKTFKVAYTPVLQEDVHDLSQYPAVMTLKFTADKVVSSTLDDLEGSYELNGDELLINFESKNEQLEIKFINFEESTKEFSSYSTIISEINQEIEESGEVQKLDLLTNKLHKDMPIELIEE